MKKKKLLPLIPFFLLMVGCEKPTEACMELSSQTAATGSQIEFTSCSINALSYEWYMEGPEDAPENEQGWSDPSFTHSFTVPGSYTVTLHAYSEFSFLGEQSTTTSTLTIN